ncbi:MAG: MFS transporter [Gemmataceae bacterium]|nr:MFS transporter [Gemmataceae bacterium]
MPSGVATAGGPAARLPGARTALALLLTINLFNYIDRQVLSAVLPKLKRDAALFDPADDWRNTKAGALTTAFMVTYMLLAPAFARAGDVVRRWLLVGVGVALWSVASGSSGLAAGYVVLLLTRMLVGVGEAAYGPIAPAMLADLYPAAERGRIMAWYNAAIPVGSALGFVVGGLVAGLFGWRHAFLVTFVGLVPAALCFLMREPARSARQPGVPRTPYGAVVRELVGTKSFVYLCSGMTATTFLLGGVAAWAPEYIFQREARFALTPAALDRLATDPQFRTLDQARPLVPPEVVDRLRPAADGAELTYDRFRAVLTERLTRDELTQYAEPVYDAATSPNSITLGTIGVGFGAVVVVAGLVATLLGGVYGDRLRNRGVRGAYFRAAGWSTLLAWPFFLAMLFVPFPYAWGPLFVAVFFLFFNTGPANTILANISRSPIRATAFAINILVIHALGDAISPTVIGYITDLSDLHTAFLLTSGFILLGGGLWVLGAKYLDADTARAEAADRDT